MVEFAINNSVHASTTHTPFCLNGLCHPRLSAQLECDSGSRGGGYLLEQKPFWLLLVTCQGTKRRERCQRRSDRHRRDSFRNSDDAIADSDEDDDAGIFNIANDYTSEDEKTLAKIENDLLAVLTRRTATNKDESAEIFLLAREAMVRFVQDSIANTVEQQEWNTDKHGRANVLQFNAGYLVLLSTVNLPEHLVSNVDSSKLLFKYIGLFRVLHRKGNAYTIELFRRMCTYPTFYVGRLRPYHQHEASFLRQIQPPRSRIPRRFFCSQVRFLI